MEALECINCTDEIEKEDNYEYVDGEIYCESCSDDILFMCEDCEEVHHSDDLVWVESTSKAICQDCADEEYSVTDCCGELVHVNDTLSVADSNEVFCSVDCLYDNEGFICENCGEAYTERSRGGSDDYGQYCDDCYQGSEYIREYHDNPSVEFFGEATNKRYFGVELELDDGDHIGFAEDINETTDERLFLMEDGSLSEQGVEVITQPMSLEEHLEGGLWEDVRNNALNHSLRSHDTRTCGMHVHVSRDGLHDTEAVDNTVFIVNRFWNQMVKFSRRDISELERWANKSVDKEDADITIADIKEARKYGRYNAINLNNHATIEFRFFKGSLRVETIKSSIQLADLIVRVANMYSENNEVIDGLEWEFITQLAKDDYGLLYDEFVRLEMI